MNVDTEQFAGVGQMAFSSLVMFTDTDEAREGINAFNEKRTPDFAPYRANA
jgi:naphthoate synthase